MEFKEVEIKRGLVEGENEGTQTDFHRKNRKQKADSAPWTAPGSKPVLAWAEGREGTDGGTG